MQCVLELAHQDEQCYTVCIEDKHQNNPKVVITVILKGHTSCYHIAETCANTDLENAKAVCSQAILYRTSKGDASLHFAVCDNHTRTVYFCLCDPSRLTFEDVSHYSLPGEAEQIAEWLRAYNYSL